MTCWHSSFLISWHAEVGGCRVPGALHCTRGKRSHWSRPAPRFSPCEEGTQCSISFVTACESQIHEICRSAHMVVQAAHAVSKGSAHKAAPAPKPVAKPWTKAQMQVAQNVRKAMMSQHESLEKAARDSAEKQYWSRIKASLAHERHRLRGFRGREAMYQARKALQDEEASDADLAITKTRQQKLRSKIDEMSSEKARSFHPPCAYDASEQRQEDKDTYDAIESHSIDYTKCGDACKTASRIVAGEIVC